MALTLKSFTGTYNTPGREDPTFDQQEALKFGEIRRADCNCAPRECRLAKTPLECPEFTLEECCCWFSIHQSRSRLRFATRSRVDVCDSTSTLANGGNDQLWL